MSSRRLLRPWLAEAAAVALLLGLHFWLALWSSRDKSATFDEIAHIGGGYLQATTGDYRFNAESGTIPQRWAAWPLTAYNLGVPPADHPARRNANVWLLGRELLYGRGRDAGSLLVAPRGMIVLVSLALAGLVYAWSRACHGPAGALLSLGLYALSPTMLAHARLATADLTAALFFLLSAGALWRLLERVTPIRLATAALATSGLLLSKMSGVLILPMAAVMIAVYLARRRPLELAWRARRPAGSPEAENLEIASRGRQALVIAALAAVIAVLVLGAIWSAYGWRYSAQPDAGPEGSEFLHSFDSQLEREGLTTRLLSIARDGRLLPEAYLWGLAYTFDTTRERDAFLRGRTSRTGWWWFFPYAVAIKTPLALFGLLGLAVAATRRRLAGTPRRLSVPLWVLIAVYSLVAIASHLNIGHRHMLPIYPVLFIFAGGAGRWLARGRRLAPVLVLLCLGAFTWESAKIRPHYLSYFNQLAGGPENGYRHLVDSSLDWGQDLPALTRFVAELRASETETPIFISYFGAARPAAFSIDANWLYSFFPVRSPRSWKPAPLTGGAYCVSATLLQTMHMELPGPWDEERERDFRWWHALAEMDNLTPGFEIETYQRLRSARLFAFLRRREPDARIGYSILVYRLSDADVDQALNAPVLL